ncbi:MAG: single-stranded DNA-binding protein [candidate division Zixibacteria bacterium]|nr:single-stranded DNA-binding protein [candidate division Zixibacteria bacterium]
MASLNKVYLIGNLGKDPEKRYTPSGQAVTTVSLATTFRWKDKSGQFQEKTDWHNLVIWGKQAESAKDILKKGDQVFVEGRIQNRSYDDRNGNKKYVSEVVAFRVMKLERKEAGPVEEPVEEPVEKDAEVTEGTDEDLPF